MKKCIKHYSIIINCNGECDDCPNTDCPSNPGYTGD